jgi:hypothetical protein
MQSSPHNENMEDNEKKGGAQWETRARRIRKRVRNRTLKSRNKRKKRNGRSNRNEVPDNKDCEVSVLWKRCGRICGRI